MLLLQKQSSIFWTDIKHKKRVFLIFHRVFNTGGKLRPNFSTIQHFSCGILGGDFLKFVYFGFFWKLKGRFWHPLIPFVYRVPDRNVENPVENVKNCGFYSPLFHTAQDPREKSKNCLLNPFRGLYKKYPSQMWKNRGTIPHKMSIPGHLFIDFFSVFQRFSTKNPHCAGKTLQNGRNLDTNVVK